MGWNPFKSEEVTRVATSVSRVISDDLLPHAVNTGAIKGIFHDGNVANYVMEELVASIGVRAERMYSYADKRYTYGMPSGEVYSSTQGHTEVEAVIELMEGQQVSMEYSHYGSLNFLHAGWAKLVSEHGYSQTTNRLAGLTTSMGTPVYLKDMVVVIPAGQEMRTGSAEQWGSAACAGYTPTRMSNVGGFVNLVKPTPINTSASTTVPYLLVTYEWAVGTTAMFGTFVIDLSGYDQGANYFHAKYLVAGVAKYWSYLNDSGGHPTLDAVYTEKPYVSGSYFPFTYFRYAKQSTISDKTAPGYKTSKRMLKIMNMDYDLIASSIDANPNIANIEQAMMTLSVPAVSTNAIECRYLFDYFDNQHSVLGDSDPSYGAIINVLSGLGGMFSGLASQFGNANTTVIQDSRFKMTLGNNGIFKRLVAGTVGAIGAYTSAYTTLSMEDSQIDVATGAVTAQTTPINCHVYRHQITVGLYEEIAVLGLRMTYFIYGGYNTVGDGTSDILMIPVDRSVSSQYSIADREVLYARSLHFIFNSRTVTEVKWYQQEWFSTVLIIVAIVLTVIDWGADGGSLISSATGLAIGSAGLLIAMIVVNIVVGMALMPKIYDLFVKVLGEDAAKALVILAVVYGGFQMYEAGGVAGCPWAGQLLSASTGIGQAIIRAEMVDLLSEYDRFNTYVSEETKLLDTAKDLLQNKSLLSPITIFGEKPEDFYNRTIHFGNIGVVGINAISSYVDIALTLPKLNDTVGEEFYAT